MGYIGFTTPIQTGLEKAGQVKPGLPDNVVQRLSVSHPPAQPYFGGYYIKFSGT